MRRRYRALTSALCDCLDWWGRGNRRVCSLQPVHSGKLGGQDENRQPGDQGKGVTKHVDHGSLLIDVHRERANYAVGNSGKVEAAVDIRKAGVGNPAFGSGARLPRRCRSAQDRRYRVRPRNVYTLRRLTCSRRLAARRHLPKITIDKRANTQKHDDIVDRSTIHSSISSSSGRR